MNRRDIVIGALVLLFLGGMLYYRSRTSNSDLKVPEAQTQSSQTESSLEEKFKVDIPDDAKKAELKDVNGGDRSGIVSKTNSDGNNTFTVLADLPEPGIGGFYQGWLVRGEEGVDNYNLVSLGRLQSAKGGYMLNFQSKNDYADYTKVVISEEKNQSNKITKSVLEGNF